MKYMLTILRTIKFDYGFPNAGRKTGDAEVLPEKVI